MSRPLDKIKKLLALSKSENENEAAIALAAAMRIAAEEGVDISGLDMNDEEILSAESSFEPQSRKIERWKCFLWIRISRMFGCAVYLNTFFNRDLKLRHRIKIAGRKCDIEIADYLGCHLQRELLRLCRKEIANVRKRRKLSAARLRESFLYGAAIRVIEKAEKLFKADPQGGIKTGYELILSRSARAESWIEKLHDLKPVKHQEKIDNRAFHSGFVQAGAINVHKAVNSPQNAQKQLEE